MTRTMHLALMERNVAQRRLRAVMHEMGLHEEARKRSGNLDVTDEHLYGRCREIIKALPTLPDTDSPEPYGVRPSVLA